MFLMLNKVSIIFYSDVETPACQIQLESTPVGD